ncbi:MAG TPA: contact-dependent growth inhibition system immunity protein [Longimicrobiales bacterium]
MYPALVQLLGGYFHPDWSSVAGRSDAVLAAMLRDEPVERLRAALRELDALLGRGLCEPQLRDVVLYELGCDFDPESEGLDTSRWLENVRSEIRRRLGQAAG